MNDAPCTLIWRRLDMPGHEWARLTSRDADWRLDGTAVFVDNGRPVRLDFTVICDADWRTSVARITGYVGEVWVDLSVVADESRNWTLNGVDCPQVAGCFDIDLGFSPSTNLLPIRRLELEVGQEAEVNAAWLPFPSLEFRRLPQRYIREAEDIYRYESSGGAFVRTLRVNQSGFVVEYPGIWVREDDDRVPRLRS